MDPQPAIPAPEPPDAPAGAAVDAVGPAPTEAEADQAMLRRLAEICMEVAEAIGRQARADLPLDPAAAAQAPPAPLLRPSNDGPPIPAPRLSPAELALAISRAARAVRMTLAFKARLAAPRASGGLEADEAEDDGRNNLKVTFVHPDDDLRAARKAEIGAIVRRIAETGVDDPLILSSSKDDNAGDEAAGDAEALDPAEAADPTERVERLVREAAERLDEVETFGDLLARPFSEFVEQVCGLLGLAPDWALLAQEPWARAELAGGAVGGPLHRWRPPPSSPLEPYRSKPTPASTSPPPPTSARAPPPPDPQADEDARLAARTAERWRLAEYGPDGRGRPDY